MSEQTSTTEPIEQTEDTQPAEHLVPVSEAKRYRKRAQSAEKELAELQSRLDEQLQLLEQREEMISSLERRQQIDALLAASDAIDIDAARLLTEMSLSVMDEPDVEAAVEELRSSKPLLFRPKPSTHSSMSPHANGSSHSIEHAASDAAISGRREDLLRYLRLRRA